MYGRTRSRLNGVEMRANLCPDKSKKPHSRLDSSLCYGSRLVLSGFQKRKGSRELGHVRRIGRCLQSARQFETGFFPSAKPIDSSLDNLSGTANGSSGDIN